MNYENEIIKRHNEGYSIETIIKSFIRIRFSVEEVAEIIAKSKVEIGVEKFYIVPSKMNYL